jgi:hypothetical protein
MALSDEFKVEADVEVAELRAALKRAQQAEAKARRKSEDLVQAVFLAARDASLASPRPKVVAPPKSKGRGKAEVALVHTTDWQLGKRTVSYGLDSAATRIEEFQTKVMQLTEIQRTHHPVKECVLLFGGDMVEGIGIFPGQQYEVEAHLFEQLFEASRMMEGMVRTFAGFFDSVRVVCEFGNHGRLGRKGDMPYADNIDRVAYKITQDRTTDLKNVSWQQSDAWYQIVEVGAYRALLVHGDEIKSFGGNTPAFGILRKCNAWASGVIEQFQDVYMGHWHQPLSLCMSNGGRVFVTGSPESHNEYAREFVAATGQPSQRLHFVDPVKGRVTAEYNVWLS